MTGLLKKLNDKTNFSNTEQVIANYIMENFREIGNYSTRQLAKKTFTSSAAIVRFSQKLGFEGYTDFKTKFLAEMMQHISEPKNKYLTDNDAINTVIEKVINIEINALRETHEQINQAQFVRATNYLAQAEHIDFYAMNANLHIAKMAAEDFVMANKYSSVYNSIQMQYLQAYQVPKTHISFFISRTGENKRLIEIAKLLNEQNSTIFLITSTANSTLANLSKVVFEVASTEKLEELGSRIFLTGAKYVIDVLFALLIMRTGYSGVKRKDE